MQARVLLRYGAVTLLAGHANVGAQSGRTAEHWVGTWATSEVGRPQTPPPPVAETPPPPPEPPPIPEAQPPPPEPPPPVVEAPPPAEEKVPAAAPAPGADADEQIMLGTKPPPK